MVNYQETRVKLKLKSKGKKKTATTLRITKKIFKVVNCFMNDF